MKHAPHPGLKRGPKLGLFGCVSAPALEKQVTM